MIKYYLHKIINKLPSWWVYFRKGNRRRSGVFEIIPPNFKFGKKVILGFWDTKLVHLGDQLFHEALIRYLVSKNIEVDAVGESWLNEYFQSLGAKIISFNDLKKMDIRGAIFVSKDDLATQFFSNFGSANAFLGMDYATIKSQEKINVEIVRNFLSLLEKVGFIKSAAEEIKQINFIPKVPDDILGNYQDLEWAKNILSQNKKFLGFNNYLASGFLEASLRKTLLEKLARQKKKEGFAIVHLGSPKEKENDHKKYDFIDYDLRGKLTPIDLIKFFALENVQGIISFDTYAMHAASLSQKDLYVVIRNQKYREEFEKKFIPFFPAPKNILKELK